MRERVRKRDGGESFPAAADGGALVLFDFFKPCSV